MMQNRRNILTVLGLFPFTSSTMSIESLNCMEVDPKSLPSMPGAMFGGKPNEAQEKICVALERLIAAIRSGEITANKIEVHSIADFEEWMKHEIKITCELGFERDAGA